MKNTLQKVAPEWHAEAVGILKENFTSIHETFLDSTKKAVWLGLFLNFIKQRGKEDKSIPHGQFLPWLEKNYPDAPARTCNTYMSLAAGVSEKGKFEIRHFSGFANCGELPKSIESIIEGKTQSQLFLEFKQTRDGEKPSRGRMPGEGALPIAQRDLRKMIDEAGKLDESFCNMWYSDTLMLLDETNATLGEQTTPTLQRMENVRLQLGHRIQKILKSRSGASARALAKTTKGSL